MIYYIEKFYYINAIYIYKDLFYYDKNDRLRLIYLKDFKFDGAIINITIEEFEKLL